MRGPARSFPHDEGGNLLLISGVLLILGFVVLGGTLTQLHSLDGTTARVQRDGVVLNVEDLMTGLQSSLYESLLTGETNVTDFQAVMMNLERGLVENAARSGLYVALVPTTEDQSIWRREDRCLGYNADATQDGVVVGYTVGDLEETIAGVVYDVHVTDGRQTMRFDYYALLEVCSADEVTSLFNTFTAVPIPQGEAIAWQETRVLDGVYGTLRETPDENSEHWIAYHPTVLEASVKRHNWNNDDGITSLDGIFAHMPSNTNAFLLGNYFRFKLIPPAGMGPDDILENITLQVMGYKLLPGALQDLYVNVYDSSPPLLPTATKLVPFTTTDSTHDIVLSGNWTRAQIEDSVWELTVQGEHESSQHWYVDHFRMNGEILQHPYRLNATMEWDEIPPIYLDHKFEMKYRIPSEGTAGEAFLVQVWDLATTEWVTIESLSYTDGDWVTIGPRPVTDYAGVDAQSWHAALFRITDSDEEDTVVPDDEDLLEVDVMRLTSTLTPP